MHDVQGDTRTRISFNEVTSWRLNNEYKRDSGIDFPVNFVKFLRASIL